MSAPSPRGRPIWCQGSHGQPRAWNKKHSERFYVSSAVIRVFVGLMSASVRTLQTKGSRARFVKDVVWTRKLVVSRSGPGSREVPGPSVPGRVRSVPSRQVSTWSSSDEAEVSFQTSLCFWTLQKRKLAAYGAFFREENITVLEAGSILYAVRHAETRYWPGRLLILSLQRALKIVCIAFRYASYRCVWLLGRSCFFSADGNLQS